MRIDKLKAWQVRGNAHSDRPALNLAHEIAVDETADMSDRLEALAQMDRIMGIAPSQVTQTDLAEYLKLVGWRQTLNQEAP